MARDQRERRREGSRRAQAARQRRMEARGRRKNRNLMYGVAGVAFALVAVIGIVVFQSGGSGLGHEIRTLPGAHNPPYEYVRETLIEGQRVSIPPTSGNHLPNLSPWGFLGDGIVVENVVHNMEHGGVVIWYRSGDEALETRVSDLVSGLGRRCIVAGVYDDMSYEVAATVWGRVFPQETLSEPELREFITEYRGTEGPEAGLCERQ